MENEEKEVFIHFAAVNTSIKSNYKFSESTWCPWDVKAQSGACYMLGELKGREKPLEFFELHPPYLELMKLTGMTMEQQRIKREKGVSVELFYFNFTVDKVVQVFKLKEVGEYNWVQRWLPRSQRDRTLVLKWVTELTGMPYQTFFI